FSTISHPHRRPVFPYTTLFRSPEREVLFGGVIIGHHAAGFHRGRDEALAGDALLDDDFGFGEGFFGLAAFLVICERYVIGPLGIDRKSTRLNSSHGSISYAVFC